ncbi:MAG TPA: thio(seleno)oxazole modification radical SAM maturase SbtM [Dissulfurispiraceae bacterium]|nr:thio(seleno)oxazole modification radical SAM maturase SbtM [Dissulfurispiraceae bacterium]
MNFTATTLLQHFPATAALLGAEDRKRFCSLLPGTVDAEALSAIFSDFAHQNAIATYAFDLFSLELERALVEASVERVPEVVDALAVNPTLRLLRVTFRGLADRLQIPSPPAVDPDPGEEYILLWRMPACGEIHVAAASREDLLALKIVAEDLDIRDLARQGDMTIGALDDLLFRAGNRGILMRPKSKIERTPEIFRYGAVQDEVYFLARGFTIQWHITQACDLHCKHCYDRSDRAPMPYDKALRILDDLHVFCEDRHVYGNVTFTGGNPFLYPHFFDLYKAAADFGFGLAILGNPAQRDTMERMLAIQKPSHIQISLEGLRERNDAVRGKGHFDRSLAFLRLLQELEIPSMVMLTLTRDNIDDVIPLANLLRNYTETFHFNRLAMVGEGAKLKLPERSALKAFMHEYLRAAEENPIMGLKDNFLNIALHEQGKPLFGGCAGFGCAAAFNFVAILPDGEVHACRKFPSPIGNIYKQPLAQIYDSAEAARYRSGCSACAPCPIRAVCGGCLAVAYGCGLDVSSEKDPLCFMEN